MLNRNLKYKSADGSTHWSSYKLTAELGDVSVSTVQRVLHKHCIKPQQLERHTVSNNPDFEAEAADLIKLYLNPPAHVRCAVWTKRPRFRHSTAKTGCCRCRPARRESRRGVQAQWPAQPVSSVQYCDRRSAAQTAASHNGEQYVASLTDVVASQPKRRKIHVISDNMSSHKT
ncbi:transposase [Caballeronia calidae]|uniref:Transposase n=1 Tax=Caballeronia calidae TaxID=1777139 RepID=A0A158E4N9_9BURK|nr:transposase [Caballeronia calidae]